MLRKYYILLILCVASFICPVSGLVYDYYPCYPIGTVIEFDHLNNTLYWDIDDGITAYTKSGLFSLTMVKRFDFNNMYWHEIYQFTAVKYGSLTIMADHWYWRDPNYYHFIVY
jgi:hypothetical protein